MQTINVKETKKLIENDQAVLIDVREPAEYRSEKIEGAENIPLSKISVSDVQKYTQNNKKVILQCNSGNRSAQAGKKIDKHDDKNFYSLEGGIESWKQAGFSTKKSEGGVLPLNRQVQLAISLMILMGLVIYILGSPYGLILPLFAGLGLLNAALTGWCGMAKVLGMMPWNQ